MNYLATMNVFRDAISVIHHEPIFLGILLQYFSINQSSSIYFCPEESISQAIYKQFFPWGWSLRPTPRHFCRLCLLRNSCLGTQLGFTMMLSCSRWWFSGISSADLLGDILKVEHLFGDSFSYRTNPFEMNWKPHHNDFQIAHLSWMNTFHLYIYTGTYFYRNILIEIYKGDPPTKGDESVPSNHVRAEGLAAMAAGAGNWLIIAFCSGKRGL